MDIKVDERTVIVFDLDDTLYNEIAYLRSAYLEIAQKIDPDNWRPLFAHMFSLFRCNLDVFGYLSKTYGTPKPDLLTAYRNHVPNLSPFENVPEIFQKIKVNNGHIGIITDGRSITQRKKLSALGLLEHIDKIVISEETGAEKPEEKNFKIIEETFKNCTYWYVADNLRKDFIAPNCLGWKTLGVIDNGLNIHHDGHLYLKEASMPRQFVISLNEINII